MRKLKSFAAALAAAGLFVAGVHTLRAKGADPAAVMQVAFKTAVEPKALSDQVKKGLTWLASHQLANGAWGQGDESPEMGSGAALRDTSSVADTSMALLAFMRAGQTASKGDYSKNVKRGVEYVLSEIEASDSDSLFVTQVRGTRVQMKIGTYVDTFAALNMLNEAKGTMPDQAANARLDKAHSKLLAKIEKNQRKDGTWDNQGWAPALTQSMASKGLNRAAQSGAPVDPSTLQRVEEQAQAGFDGRGFAKDGTAGVDLYGAAANASSQRESANTRAVREDELKRKVNEAKTDAERAKYAGELRASEKARSSADGAEKGLISRLDDPSFMRGFGNNGGEEFLSYMLVSEALVVKGGAEWKKWDGAITQLVNGVQNGDGSWTGHHCITGRTFCTAAALMVLMADRTPVPVANKLRG